MPDAFSAWPDDSDLASRVTIVAVGRNGTPVRARTLSLEAFANSSLHADLASALMVRKVSLERPPLTTTAPGYWTNDSSKFRASFWWARSTGFHSIGAM